MSSALIVILGCILVPAVVMFALAALDLAGSASRPETRIPPNAVPAPATSPSGVAPAGADPDFTLTGADQLDIAGQTKRCRS